MTCDYHADLFARVHVRWDTHMTDAEKAAWADGIARQCPRCRGVPEKRYMPREAER